MHIQVERVYIYLMIFINEIGMILPVNFSLYNGYSSLFDNYISRFYFSSLTLNTNKAPCQFGLYWLTRLLTDYLGAARLSLFRQY